MDLREYYLGLTAEEREAYAKRAGTTVAYMPQIINVRPFKTPKPRLMRALATASEGAVSLDEVLRHFYGTDEDDEVRVREPNRRATPQATAG